MSPSENSPVLAIMGPTATGKTDLAAALADRYPIEIISVDSSLVYRGMDIGTAKPDAAFLKCYPHHLVDIRMPDDPYSAADFVADACRLIDRARAAGKFPVLVGGSMFYFHALEHGLTDLPAADPELRAELEADAERRGWPALHRDLARRDADSAARIDPNDAQRIQRALEVWRRTGFTMAQLAARGATGRRGLFKLALSSSDRGRLHARIARRFDTMLERGLRDEVQGLLDAGVDTGAPAMRMVGYRQMIAHLNGVYDYSRMRDAALAATRQLAKRQLTWLRNQTNVTWWVDYGVKRGDFAEILAFIDEILAKIKQ